MEHDEQADRLDEDADTLEQHSDQLGERIDDIQDDWEHKEQDPAVPGARPDPDEDAESMPGVNADEDVVSDEGGP